MCLRLKQKTYFDFSGQSPTNVRKPCERGGKMLSEQHCKKAKNCVSGLLRQKENAGFEYQGRGVKRKKSTIIRPLVACLKFLHRDLQIVLKEI